MGNGAMGPLAWLCAAILILGHAGSVRADTALIVVDMQSDFMDDGPGGFARCQRWLRFARWRPTCRAALGGAPVYLLH